MKFFYWLPRILGIVYISFLTMFSLDVFGSGGSIWEEIVGFIIHSAPSIVLLALLIIAWRRPKLGSIIFFGFSGLFYLFVLLNYLFSSNRNVMDVVLNALILCVPAFILGLMFLMDNSFNQNKYNNS